MKTTHQLADTHQGWVKLQRSILDSPIIKNSTLLQTYMWSLLKANHQPKWFSIKVGKGYQEMHCDVGQFITGRNRAADELGMPGSTWYTNITKLKDYGYLEIDSNSHYSLITVVNYGGTAPIAMPLEQQKKKAKNNKLATKKQVKSTNKNFEKEKKEKINRSNYSFFLISDSFKNLTKSLQEEYIEIAKLLENEMKIIHFNFKPLKPTQYKFLRRSFSFIEIQSTLVTLNNNPQHTDVKSLYLQVKYTLKKGIRNSLKTCEPMEEGDYIQTAFELFNKKITDEHPRVAAIPKQISIKAFSSLFIKYDIADIFKKLEHLDKWESISKQKSLSKILQTFLYKDKNIHPLNDGEINSFIKEQKRLARKKKSEIEDQKREDEFQHYFESVKNIDAWKKLKYIPKTADRERFVRDYLAFIEIIENEDYPGFAHLSQLTLEQAIKYDDEHQNLEWVGSQLDEFHKSSTVEKHTSAYEFLLEQTIALYPEGWDDEEN